MQENILEGKKIDNLDTTSVSETEAEAPVEENVEPIVEEHKEVVELNSNPIPTVEEQEDAGLVENSEISESSEPVALDNVSDAPTDEEASVENVEQKPLVHEELGVIETPTKTFTQSQVDDIAGKTRLETREKTFRYIYDRYGVNSEEELDDLIGNAQRYDSLSEEFGAAKSEWAKADELRNQELSEVKEKVALMESGIDKERYEDAKLILKGKGLDVTVENIQNELATHPEWSGKKQDEKPFEKVETSELNQNPAEPASKISVLGNENNSPEDGQMSEEDYAMQKLFKL